MGYLRSRVLLLLFAITAIFALAIVAWHWQKRQEIKELHLLATERHAEVANSMLELTGSRLAMFVLDYSLWDEMVDFIRRPTAEWAKTNLRDSMANFSMSALAVYDLSGKTIYTANTDDDASKQVFQLSPLEIERCFRGDSFCHFYQTSSRGIVEIRGATVNASNDSARTGPRHGYLFVAKVWDAEYLKSMGEILGARVNLDSRSETRTEADEDCRNLDFTQVLCDLQGIPISSLRITKEFAESQRYHSLALRSLLLLGAFGAIVLGVLYASLSVLVVRPVACLSRALQSESPEPLLMIESHQSEFGRLATVVRQFLRQKSDLENESRHRRIAMDALRESESHLAATLASIGDGVISTDAEGRVTSLNHMAELLTGWSTENARGMAIRDVFNIVNADTRREVDNPVHRALSEGIIVGLANHTVLIARDGTERQIADSCAPIRRADDEILGAVLVFRDVTEEYRQREMLDAAHERFDQIAEQSHEIIWEVNGDGLYTYVSRACSALLGYSVDEVVGRLHFYDLHPSEGRETFRAEVFAAMQRGEEFRDLHNQVTSKDGRILDVLTNAVPTYGEDGSLRGYCGSDKDITERRQSEKRLVDTIAKLENANRKLADLHQCAESATRAKSEFLANMSHEIRTPMAAILGYLDLLDTGCSGGCQFGRSELPSHVSTIRRNGEHLVALINDILDLSKVESGKLEISRERCSPFTLLDETAALMRVRVEAKSLRLQVEIPDPIPETIQTDPLRLRQVLVNLVGNAIKFTDQGLVCITARLVGEVGRERLQLAVSDTGIGMSAEQIAKLFQPFSQVDTSAARRYGGTGLGLAISKRLVEAIGGEIEVRSSPGEGSTFRVTIDPGPLDGIPRIRPSAVTTPTTVATSTPPFAAALHGRVLLAEDSSDNRRLLGFLLKQAGAAVTAVENGQLALEEAMKAWEAGQPFEVILMDMQMPELDGYDATRQLRAVGYNGPIIALTAHAMGGDRQKCLDAGCDDYLSKPIDRRLLIGTVAQWTVCATTAV